MRGAGLVLVVTLVAFVFGCSGKAKEAEKPAGSGGGGATATEVAGGSRAGAGTRDRGAPCARHEYVLEPGEQRQLVFEKRLGQGPEDPPEVTLATEALGGTGVGVEYVSSDLASYQFPVWLVLRLTGGR